MYVPCSPRLAVLAALALGCGCAPVASGIQAQAGAQAKSTTTTKKPSFMALKTAPQNPRVTRENFDKLQWEMTLGEIEKILGPYDTPSEQEVFEHLNINYESVRDSRRFLRKLNPVYDRFTGTQCRWQNGEVTIFAMLADPPSPSAKAYGFNLVRKPAHTPELIYIDWRRAAQTGHATQTFSPGQPARLEVESEEYGSRSKDTYEWQVTIHEN